MTNPIIRIHNAETDEIIDREMTASELKDYLAQKEKAQQEKAAILENQAKKAVLLTKLGITADEAKLLLS
jgi:hypothetical protein